MCACAQTKEIIDCGLKVRATSLLPLPAPLCADTSRAAVWTRVQIQELRSLHRDMQVYWGPLYPAFVKIRELTRDTARAAANSRV